MVGNIWLKIKDDMLYPLHVHAALTQEKALFRQTLLPRLAASRFPPASKLMGIQRVFYEVEAIATPEKRVRETEGKCPGGDLEINCSYVEARTQEACGRPVGG